MRTFLLVVLVSGAAAGAEAPQGVEPEPQSAVPSLTPAAKADEAPTVAAEPVKMASRIRPLSYAVLGLSVIAAGVGVYFGATSAGERAQLRADRDAGIFSQQALYDRDQTAITQAKLANGLFISAAVVAVVGLVMFILGD